jgi:hypothetical protein
MGGISLQELNVKEDEGMWGLGAGTLSGAVRVTLFDEERGERYKTPMTLSQMRLHMVRRAFAVQQDGTYRWAAPCGALAAALLPTVFNLGSWAMDVSASFRAAPAGGTCARGGWGYCVVLGAELLRAAAAQRACAVVYGITSLSMCSVLFLALPIFREVGGACGGTCGWLPGAGLEADELCVCVLASPRSCLQRS